MAKTIYECDTSDLYDVNLEGPEHEAIEQAHAALRDAGMK